MFARSGVPQKRYVDDGHVGPLSSLPDGDYLKIAYHPSGLALAFVVARHGDQSIWISSNEGTDPQRLVFSEEGTEFTSIAFSPDGQRLWWVAEHREGYPELHWMDLADRSGFGDGWRGEVGRYADDLLLAPHGRLKSLEAGTACEERRALVLTGESVSAAMPGETRPTSAVGWLDSTTLLEGMHHHLGTTRMHVDPRQGVVDPDCRVHSVDNLFVAGSSVFPTYGASNPTLTIVALALRLSDKLREVLNQSSVQGVDRSGC